MKRGHLHPFAAVFSGHLHLVQTVETRASQVDSCRLHGTRYSARYASGLRHGRVHVMRRVQAAGGIALAGTICAALLASSSAAAVDRMSSCPGGKIRTASGCTSPAAAGRQVRAIAQVDSGGGRAQAVVLDRALHGRSLVRVAGGESMAGVPANLRMHRQAGGKAAAQPDPPPARLAQHADLRTATYPSAGTARVHRRARSIRGFDVLGPVVDDRREHDHDGDDRRRDEVGQGARYGSADLQGRRARADCTDVGRASGVQPEPLLRARCRDLEHLGDSEPRAERLHRDHGLSALGTDLGRPRRHEG
jgi:hypothetical protein